MTTPQPAAAAPAATPPPAAPAPKKGLDDFLREFDAAQPPAPAPQPAPKPAAKVEGADAIAEAIGAEVEKRLAPIRGVVAEVRRDRELREIDGIVESVRGASDFLKNVDPDLVFGHLQGLGVRDPRFRAAFMQRAQKPEEWKAVLKAVGDQLEEKLKPIAAAPSATARAAVIAAARVSGTAPSEGEKTQTDVRQMNDSQFRAYKRQLAARGRR